MTRPAIALGVALGVGYTLSPLTMVVAVMSVPAAVAALARLGRRERRWIGAGLIAAVAARLLAVVVLLLATNPAREQFLAWFPDARYAIARSWWIQNTWLHIPIGPLYTFGVHDRYGASSFSYVLAVAQTMFGEAPYGVNLISIACLVGGALLLFRFMRRAYGAVPAAAMLAVLLFWPTIFAWSVSALRESAQLLLAAVAVVGTVSAVRGRGLTRVGGAAAALLAILALGTLREGALAIVLAGLSLGLLFRLLTLRTRLSGAVAALLVGGSVILAASADVRHFIEYQTDLAANRHLGQATSVGRSFKLLDQRFYEQGPQSTMTVTFAEAARFFARSVAAFVLVPAPWRAASWSELAIAPQQCAWYLMIALALVGLRPAWRRDALATALLGGYVVAGLILIAPNSGNIGTLVRHRDIVVPFVACLSAVGFCELLARWSWSPIAGAEPRRRPRLRWTDERGRMFGWLNPVDGTAALLVMLTIAVGLATVRVFAVAPPSITAVVPAVLESGNDRLRLEGRAFRRYLRVFVGVTGRPFSFADPITQKSEATVVDAAANMLTVRVPQETAPGTYDLYIYDEGREVARRVAAFTLRAPSAPSSASR